MGEAELRAALERRRDLYRAKRDKMDAAADDTLTEWEKYDFGAEAIEYMAADLGVQLSAVDDRA